MQTDWQRAYSDLSDYKYLSSYLTPTKTKNKKNKHNNDDVINYKKQTVQRSYTSTDQYTLLDNEDV